MNRLTKIAILSLSILALSACGGGSSGSNPIDNSSLLPEDKGANIPGVNLTKEPINTGNIPTITPSSQTSDEIISLIKNAQNNIPFEEIVTGIVQASGSGPFYAADENGSVVLMAFMAEKYFGKNNWVFCHESTNDCHRVIDNSNNQRFVNLTQFADGKMFMLTMDRNADPGLYGYTLAYYDPNTREFVQNAIDLHGVNGGSDMSLGVDGYLYLSGSNHLDANHYATYVKVNPKDLSDISYHRDYYKDLYVDRTRSIGADNTHVYQAMGDGDWHLIAINQETQTSVKLLEAKYIDVLQLKDGCALKYTDSQDVQHKAWLFEGRLYPTDTLDELPPWYDASIHLPNHQGGYWAFKETYFITDGVARPTITGINLEAQATSNNMGTIFMNPLINDVQFEFSIEVDMYEQPVSHVEKVDENRMMLKGRSYSGYSMMNTNDDSTKYLGKVGNSGNTNGVFFDYSSNEKKFMISGYPSANTYYYTLDETNKKFSSENINGSLGYLRKLPDRNNPGEGIDIDIHRTLDMVQIGEVVYFIGMQYRSGVGGALVAWNTRTDEMYALKKGIFDNYQPRSMIKIGNKIAIATQAMDNSEWGGETRPSTPKVLIFDPETQSIVKEYTPLAGIPAIDAGRIQSLDDRHIIGLTNNGGTSDYDGSLPYSSKIFLYIIDTYTDEVVMKKTIKTGNYMRVEREGSAMIHGFHFIADGEYIYTWLGARTLSTIDKNGNIESHGLMPYQSKMGFANGSIYITGEKKLRKIEDPKK